MFFSTGLQFCCTNWDVVNRQITKKKKNLSFSFFDKIFLKFSFAQGLRICRYAHHICFSFPPFPSPSSSLLLSLFLLPSSPSSSSFFPPLLLSFVLQTHSHSVPLVKVLIVVFFEMHAIHENQEVLETIFGSFDTHLHLHTVSQVCNSFQSKFYFIYK